ncbi:unnamed protein product [Durusdinium trenchii]|uniref:Uncharacterized protein n=1 Tax=Durusdinium trenchii TaxID=1381693 RepID=A0ABP0PUR1_9DINO
MKRLQTLGLTECMFPFVNYILFRICEEDIRQIQTAPCEETRFLQSRSHEFISRCRLFAVKFPCWFRYSACIFFTLATMVFSGRVHSVYHRGYFYGFTRHTVFTILLQAVAGLTVSRILKYADAVQKNVAASLRGPILVCVSPLVGSMANTQTLLSALLVSCGCTIYLLQGPLSASESKAEQTGQTR